jgi:CO/xanthine dehydrogenase Mo-binding subunit
VGGCVANALFQATGKRMRAMPFTPERIMATLKA